MNEIIRTPHLIAHDAVDAMLTEPGSASTVRDFLVGLMEETLRLSMTPEWDMEDNFAMTEGVVKDLRAFIPALTDAEVVRAAAEYGLSADDLDHPYDDAHNRAMELTEED